MTKGSLMYVFVALIVVTLPVFDRNKLPLIVTLLFSVNVEANRLPVSVPVAILAAVMVLSVI